MIAWPYISASQGWRQPQNIHQAGWLPITGLFRGIFGVRRCLQHHTCVVMCS